MAGCSLHLDGRAGPHWVMQNAAAIKKASLHFLGEAEVVLCFSLGGGVNQATILSLSVYSQCVYDRLNMTYLWCREFGA